MDSITAIASKVTQEEEENEAGLIFQSDELQQPVVRPLSWSLIGRFLTHRPIKTHYMKNVLADLWRPSRGICISELGQNLFQFEFFHPLERDRVIRGGPWTFDQKLLVTDVMKEDVDPGEMKLDQAEFWVRVYDLPIGFMQETVAVSIGNFIGEFVESDQNNFTGIGRIYMRIRVRINVLYPLKRKMKIRKSTGGDFSWINFKYERLPTFCFFCGKLGHPDKYCGSLLEVADPMKVERVYVAWLRASTRRNQELPQSRFLLNSPVPETIDSIEN